MIHLRPHHLMCAMAFIGFGYSNNFIKNFSSIKKLLDENHDTEIYISSSIDMICSACPSNVDNKFCKQEQKILDLDINHSTIMNLHEGMILKWADALYLIKTHMTAAKFHVACHSCEWKSYGICYNALTQLIESDD